MPRTKAEIKAKAEQVRRERMGITESEAQELDEKPELDLDDAVTQEKIINPDPGVVELSYGTIRTYPPSAMIRRLAFGFCTNIIADAGDKPSRTVDAYAMRVMSTLMASAGPQLQLFKLIAYMCGKPGQIDDKAALELSTEIAEKASPSDVADLFKVLCDASGINKTGAATAKK